jgi:UTP-glucose-1-phosphate uridylyltransferase
MSGSDMTQVVVAAGGLGTRVGQWARFIPKEFYPVDGRPGITHLLEEIAVLSPAQVVIVYHPYYEAFAAWARQVLSEHGQARYAHLAGRDFGAVLPPGLTISFVPQRGPYADLTSVVNGADHLASPDELYVAFADNLYGDPNPLRALRGTAPGQVAVLASRYRPELAGSHGVIAATGKPGQRLMIGLAEKPGPAQARELERHYGRRNLLLLEGRARLTATFTDFARARISPSHAEPKLALAIAAYAASHPVRIVETSADVTDLGALAVPDAGSTVSPPATGLAWAGGTMTTAAPGARRSSG